MSTYYFTVPRSRRMNVLRAAFRCLWTGKMVLDFSEAPKVRKDHPVPKTEKSPRHDTQEDLRRGLRQAVDNYAFEAEHAGYEQMDEEQREAFRGIFRKMQDALDNMDEMDEILAKNPNVKPLRPKD